MVDQIAVDSRAVLFLAGCVLGIVVVVDVRVRNGLSPGISAVLIGALFGAIIAWTAFDVTHFVKKPDEFIHVEEHHDVGG